MPDVKTIMLIMALGGVLGVVLLVVAAMGFKKKSTPVRTGFRIAWIVVLGVGLGLFFLGGIATLGMAMLSAICGLNR